MPMTLDIPDVTAPLQALETWLAEPATKERLQTAVAGAIADVEAYILSSTSRRVPRQPEERRDGFRPWLNTFAAHGFEHWLNSYKHQLARRIQTETLSAFPEFSGLRNREMIRETVETLVWPEIEPLLRDRAEELLLVYAVRGLALTWASRNLGDNLLIGVPERQETGWLVPLHLRGSQAYAASLKLNRDGEVLSEAEKLLTKIVAAA